RGAMGLEFAQAMMKIGHPVAVFLNLDAVKLALRTGEEEKKSSMQQIPRVLVADLIRGGAVVLLCQPCLEEFGLRLDDIVPGVQLGRPGYLENFVSAANVRTWTWWACATRLVLGSAASTAATTVRKVHRSRAATT